MTELTLTVERVIQAPPNVVFDAWLDPDKLSRFMHPGENMSVPSAKSDAKEGGSFEIIMKAGDNEIPHHGTYRKISRHDHLEFTWVSPFSPEDSVVELDFAPVDDGTHVTLTHTRFLGEEERNNHQGGWTNILMALDKLCAA